jgi:hypothetical protein
MAIGPGGISELDLRGRRPEEAKARLEDVWEIEERGPYPLQQADAYNVLVLLGSAGTPGGTCPRDGASP